MEFPNNEATTLTGKIMSNFSDWSDDPVMVLETPEFNKAYSRIYDILDKALIQDITGTKEAQPEKFKSHGNRAERRRKDAELRKKMKRKEDSNV